MMPPKAKVTRPAIVAAALQLIRTGGLPALNARAIAAELHCSTQPIFHLYASMEDVKADVIAAAHAHYAAFFDEQMQRDDVPPYKASGLAYIRYAQQEPELFKLLFMRVRTPEQMREGEHSYDVAIGIITERTGLSLADAQRLHLQMWITAHGIATLLVTAYLDLTVERIGEMLTDAYRGAMLLLQAPPKG